MAEYVAMPPNIKLPAGSVLDEKLFRVNFPNVPARRFGSSATSVSFLYVWEIGYQFEQFITFILHWAFLIKSAVK